MAHWNIFLFFGVYTDGMPHMHVLAVVSCKCQLVNKPAIRLASWLQSSSMHVWPFVSIPLLFSAAFSDAGSFWMLYCDICITFEDTKGDRWMLIFHVYIIQLRKYALYQVTYGLAQKRTHFLFSRLTISSYCYTASCIHFFSHLLMYSKRGMYLLWLESKLKSNAKAKSLNVSSIKPHIHANLKFVCTIFIHVYVNVVCKKKKKSLDIFNHCQS